MVKKSATVVKSTTLSRSGISSLEVTRPISFPPTLSGMAVVIICEFQKKGDLINDLPTLKRNVDITISVFKSIHLSLRSIPGVRLHLIAWPPFLLSIEVHSHFGLLMKLSVQIVKKCYGDIIAEKKHLQFKQSC